MLKIVGGFFLLCLLSIWVIQVLTPADGNVRIERACGSVVGTTSRVIVALTAVTQEQYVPDVKRWFESVDYDCRYALWVMFYEEEYNRAKEEEQAAGRVLLAPEQQTSESGSDGTRKPQRHEPPRTEPIVDLMPDPVKPAATPVERP